MLRVPENSRLLLRGSLILFNQFVREHFPNRQSAWLGCNPVDQRLAGAVVDSAYAALVNYPLAFLGVDRRVVHVAVDEEVDAEYEDIRAGHGVDMSLRRCSFGRAIGGQSVPELVRRHRRLLCCARSEWRQTIGLNTVRPMGDDGLKLQRELGWGTLTHELRRRGEPLREWFEERFPYKKRLFEDVRQAAGRHIAVAPHHQSSQTVGWAFELVLRFMLDPSAQASEAYSGIGVEVLRAAAMQGHRGEELRRIRHEWTCSRP